MIRGVMTEGGKLSTKERKTNAVLRKDRPIGTPTNLGIHEPAAGSHRSSTRIPGHRSVSCTLVPVPPRTPPQSKLVRPDECARACSERKPPRICYYHFTVEYYIVLEAQAEDVDRSDQSGLVQAGGHVLR
ncbi:hypothetical protein pipiens_015927 [Culex pipiens pipiens]|uniref:Uncharacterized protein n=1 Tax=Culex pipiens pipiens TaxID=38569 RepID=A0ABD1CNJ9_CULPP